MAEDFEDLYREHFQFIYLYALSLTRNEDLAEEITQETFFRVLEHLDQFEGKSRVTTWMCQIAKNLYLSHCRTAGHVVSPDLMPPDTKKSPEVEQTMIDKEQAMAVHKVLHKLPEPYREVFELRLFAELSFSQIGEIFGRTEGWARITYYRAKLKIKEGLS